MVFDCRFLRNPYWEKKIRSNTGLDNVVADYIQMDINWPPFYKKTVDLIMFLLPKTVFLNAQKAAAEARRL